MVIYTESSLCYDLVRGWWVCWLREDKTKWETGLSKRTVTNKLLERLNAGL